MNGLDTIKTNTVSAALQLTSSSGIPVQKLFQSFTLPKVTEVPAFFIKKKEVLFNDS
jgi:hypothetical protein